MIQRCSQKRLIMRQTTQDNPQSKPIPALSATLMNDKPKELGMKLRERRCNLFTRVPIHGERLWCSVFSNHSCWQRAYLENGAEESSVLLYPEVILCYLWFCKTLSAVKICKHGCKCSLCVCVYVCVCVF